MPTPAVSPALLRFHLASVLHQRRVRISSGRLLWRAHDYPFNIVKFPRQCVKNSMKATFGAPMLFEAQYQIDEKTYQPEVGGSH
jgi:hypothetical protein